MNVVIIEDEKPALDKLVKSVKKCSAKITIAAALSSVKESIRWFENNPAPELILMDIQLTDGSSFDILKKCNITSPVIFITAYDEHLLDAFEFNSIDYLLKPVKQEKLEQALNKYLSLKKHFTYNYASLALQENPKPGRERILVKKGIEFVSIRTEEISHFYTEHKIVFLVDLKGSRYIVDKPLTVLEEELDDQKFFRANRKYIVNIDAIKKFKPYEKGKILLEISPQPAEEITVSQENAGAFKRWIDR